MRNKGQALVEFIIILPVFLLILLSIIDFGNILYQKYQLENNLDYIVNLYNDNKLNEINSYVSKNKLDINLEEISVTNKIIVTKKVQITSPGLYAILENPYHIKAEREMYVE